jgi:2'-5' RNA ligase
LELVRALESGLGKRGIPFDKRPYKPHITLLRNGDCHKTFNPGEAPNENPALKPVRWLARDYVLVKSSLRPDGARYEELGRWPLL